MSSLERGYSEWQMTIKFPLGTEVDVKDEEFFFSGIWLCVTGISGSRHFERSYFLHLQEFLSGLSKTRPVDCRMWPTQILILKTFYCPYSYGIMHSRNPAKLNARINLHSFFLACEKSANEGRLGNVDVTLMLWLKMPSSVSYLFRSLFWVGKGRLSTSGTAYPWCSVLSQMNGFLKDTAVSTLKLAWPHASATVAIVKIVFSISLYSESLQLKSWSQDRLF